MEDIGCSIHNYVQEVHKYISRQMDYADLSQNRSFSPQVICASDAISDTELAIEAFIGNAFSDQRLLYLAIYGLLQAIFVQQYAIIHLCNYLGIEDEIKNYPYLVEIREIRNDSVGHPSKRDHKGNIKSYHQILQNTMTKNGFELLSNFSDGISKRKHVCIAELIINQRKFVSEILYKLIDRLEEDEVAHKERFRAEKLADIFPPATDYFLSKIFENAHGSGLLAAGIAALNEMKTALQEFVKALGNRYTNPHEMFTLELLDHSMKLLDSFFKARANGEEPTIEEETARIFSIFLKDQINKIREDAKEIDCNYNS